MAKDRGTGDEVEVIRMILDENPVLRRKVLDKMKQVKEEKERRDKKDGKSAPSAVAK